MYFHVVSLFIVNLFLYFEDNAIEVDNIMLEEKFKSEVGITLLLMVNS